MCSSIKQISLAMSLSSMSSSFCKTLLTRRIGLGADGGVWVRLDKAASRSMKVLLLLLADFVTSSNKRLAMSGFSATIFNPYTESTWLSIARKGQHSRFDATFSFYFFPGKDVVLLIDLDFLSVCSAVQPPAVVKMTSFKASHQTLSKLVNHDWARGAGARSFCVWVCSPWKESARSKSCDRQSKCPH